MAIDDPLRTVLDVEVEAAGGYLVDRGLNLKSARDRDDRLDVGETWEQREAHAQAEFDEALDELATLKRVERRLRWKDRGEDRD